MVSCELRRDRVFATGERGPSMEQPKVYGQAGEVTGGGCRKDEEKERRETLVKWERVMMISNSGPITFLNSVRA